MSAAPVAFVSAEGVPAEPQSIGQFKVTVGDVVWTSDGSNKTADATITPGLVGLSGLVGAVYLGEAADVDNVSDHPKELHVTVTGNTIVLTARDADGAALDLDSTDVAAVRVAFIGF